MRLSKRLQKARERYLGQSTGPAGRGRGCAVTGCKRHPESGQILCAECRRHVPRDLHADLQDAWRSYRRAVLRLERKSSEIDDAQNHYQFIVSEAARIAAEKQRGDRPA